MSKSKHLFKENLVYALFLLILKKKFSLRIVYLFFLDLSLHLKKRNIFMKLNFSCRRLLKTHEVKDFSYLQ